MRYEISGNLMQTMAIDLAPGETVNSQTNTMAWMNDQVTMDAHTGGGFLAGLRRSFGGGSFFITDFTAKAPSAVFLILELNSPFNGLFLIPAASVEETMQSIGG